MTEPRALVAVLTHDSAAHLNTCFRSLARAGAQVLAVDNASTDGTAEKLRRDFPQVELLRNRENLGYAAGNNLALRLAMERGYDYVCLLNPDTEVEPDFLAEALRVARQPRCGSVQPLLLLADDPQRINSSGNRIHFLGFGSCGQLGEPRAQAPAQPVEIPFASGACALYSTAALRETGLLDERYFLYGEDLDLGWRLRLCGYRNLLAPRSVVRHRYRFEGPPEKFYALERNRYLSLFKNLRARSLLLLSPLLLGAEAAVLLHAARRGWLLEKLRADLDALRAARGPRPARTLTDREVAQWFDATLQLDGKALPGSALLEKIWRVLRPLLG